jgi:hypothetical protein
MQIAHMRQAGWMASAFVASVLAGAALAAAEEDPLPVIVVSNRPAVPSAPPPSLSPVGTNAVRLADEVVARVGARELRRSEMEKGARSLLREMLETRAMKEPPAGREAELMQFFRRRAVTAFINRSLLFAEAERRGIVVTPADRSNGVTKVEALLRARGVKSLEELFADPQYGEAMRHDFEETTRIEKLLDGTVRKSIQVDDADREALVQEMNARRAEGKQKLEALRVLLATGKDFAALARSHSDHPSAHMGGDLGTFTRGTNNDPALDEAAFNQPTNAVGPVVEGRAGYFLLLVTSRTAAQPATAEAPAKPESAQARIILKHVPPVLTRVEIDRVLQRRKYDKAYRDLIRELRTGAKIESIFPELAASATNAIGGARFPGIPPKLGVPAEAAPETGNTP